MSIVTFKCKSCIYTFDLHHACFSQVSCTLDLLSAGVVESYMYVKIYICLVMFELFSTLKYTIKSFVYSNLN